MYDGEFLLFAVNGRAIILDKAVRGRFAMRCQTEVLLLVVDVNFMSRGI